MPSGPFPSRITCSASSGSGPRTSGHGDGSYILPETTAEIEFNTAEKYRNTHFREKDWENAPYRVAISLCRSSLKTWPKRGMKSNNPVKGSFWQTDEGHFFRTGNRVHACGKY